MKISVITVCLNCREAFVHTHDSVQNHVGADIEYIVVDGGSTDGTKDFIQNSSFISKWISEKDSGIYEAMNKGIAMATGNALIFLNAGDFFVGDPLKTITTAPALVPVKTLRLKKYEVLLKTKSYKSGLPYCHQGIVFENKGLNYNLNYRVASDYDFYLRHSYTNINLSFDLSAGHVWYDNSGFSQKNAAKRDKEIGKIILKNFGTFHFFKFKIFAYIKILIKKLLIR